MSLEGGERRNVDKSDDLDQAIRESAQIAATIAAEKAAEEEEELAAVLEESKREHEREYCCPGLDSAIHRSLETAERAKRKQKHEKQKWKKI